MLILRYAWRNLWRNWKRTAITLAAVTFSTAILIVSYALFEGMIVQMVSNATNLSVGEVQVHAPEYREERSFYDSLDDPDSVLRTAEAAGAGAVPRSFGFGLSACETKSAGTLFWGVDPGFENRFFDLPKHIARGSFLSNTPKRGIVLGKKLAHALDADIGDEIVTLVQGGDGSLGNELFTVVGIMKAMGEEIDRTAAIIHADDFAELFVSGGRVHQIALNTRGKIPPQALAEQVSEALPGTDVKTWRGILPALSDILYMFDGFMVIFCGVFCLAAGLGVMNTMLMATFERIREFGAMKALGATPFRIVRDVAAEALILSFLATLIGVAIALPSCYLLKIYGIDTTTIGGDISAAGVAFDPIWRASVTVRHVVLSVLAMWVFALLASLYPATLAARLDPVEAMRRV